LSDREGAIRAWEDLLEVNPLAMAGNNQSVDQFVKHYKKAMTKTGLIKDIAHMNNDKQTNRLPDLLWDLFASVKLTVVVLILLAATSVVGTLIPQNADPALYMRAYGQFVYRLLEILDIFDMYYSWWFQTLIGILTVNITVCTIKRWPVIWKIVSSRNLQIGSIENKQPLSEFSDSRNPQELDSLYQAYVEKKYSNFKLESEKKGFQIVAEKDIIVNDPLRYKGINFFQSSYGAMPPKNFQISFSSTNSNQSALHELSIGQSVELPDGAGHFAVREYVRDYIFRGKRVGGAILGVIDKPGNEPMEIAIPLRFPTFDKMRKGDWIISVEGYDNAYYTGLQVTRDPGVLFVYAGFILLILGCWVAFFMSHQKVVVDVKSSSNSSRIRVFGSTNRNRLGFEIAARKLGEQLGKL